MCPWISWEIEITRLHSRVIHYDIVNAGFPFLKTLEFQEELAHKIDAYDQIKNDCLQAVDTNAIFVGKNILEKVLAWLMSFPSALSLRKRAIAFEVGKPR